MSTRDCDLDISRVDVRHGVDQRLRADAARRSSLSVRELDWERAAGRILAKRKGAKVLIPVSELERFGASLPWDEPKR